MTEDDGALWRAWKTIRWAWSKVLDGVAGVIWYFLIFAVALLVLRALWNWLGPELGLKPWPEVL
jgi:hypothetical protein